MWENLLYFMIKFSFVSLIGYAMVRGVLVHVINNIYGGKLALAQTKIDKQESK